MNVPFSKPVIRKKVFPKIIKEADIQKLNTPNKVFVYCSKCGKKLLERTPNGLFRFIFGGKNAKTAPVDLVISGSVRIKCIRRSCKFINIFNYFPNSGKKKT